MAMIPLNSVLESDHVEVFPFFKWKLFSSVPDWEISEYALIIDAIDGEVPAEIHYMIPSHEISHRKALRSVATICRQPDRCDEAVADVIFPIIQQVLGEHSIDFSIVRARIDLREVLDDVDDFADGHLVGTDFFRPSDVIGQWNTETGRIGGAAQDS